MQDGLSDVQSLTKAVRLHIGLVHHIQAVLVAQLVPALTAISKDLDRTALSASIFSLHCLPCNV